MKRNGEVGGGGDREGGSGEESADKNYMHNNMQRCVSRREETSLRRNVCVSHKNALSRRAASRGMSRDLQKKKRREKRGTTKFEVFFHVHA